MFTSKNKTGLYLLLLLFLNLFSSSLSLTASDSLKDAFSCKFKVGTSVSPSELNSGGSDFIKKHFNSITPENELKPDSILNQSASQQKGSNVNPQVSLSNGTKTTLKFCEDNGIFLRGHTFVWHSQTPDWLFKENFGNGNWVSKDIMNQRLENMIKNTFEVLASSFPNLKIYAYDVCNELFLNDGGGMRGKDGSKWMQVYGDDSFAINAFTYARKYAPKDCKLFLNDYNEYISNKTNDIYSLAMKLKDLGVIDGIGMQSHVGVTFPSMADYQKGMEKFLSSGLEVQVTELDCSNPNGEDDTQAAFFKMVYSLGVEHSDQVTSITVWGTNDSISWKKEKSPLMFKAGYQPKKAFDAVMSVAAC